MRILALGLCAFALSAPEALFGQAVYGSISGNVTDSSGAAVPNAKAMSSFLVPNNGPPWNVDSCIRSRYPPVDSPVVASISAGFIITRTDAGDAFEGPSLVEERESTTVILPGDAARVDELGHLVIEIDRGRRNVA